MDPSQPCIWYAEKDTNTPLSKMLSKSKCTKDMFSMALVNLNPPETSNPKKQYHIANFVGESDGNTNSLGDLDTCRFPRLCTHPTASSTLL